MNRRILLAMLLFGLVFFPSTVALTQTVDEGDFEFDDAGVPPASDTATMTQTQVMPAQSGLVCKIGRWLSGPRAGTSEHIGAVTVFKVCGNIQIGGRWYHILKIQRLPGKIIITVRLV